MVMILDMTWLYTWAVALLHGAHHWPFAIGP